MLQIMALLPLLALAVLLALVAVNHLANSFYLSHFSSQLLEYPPPAGSIVMKDSARVGVCESCNAGQCDFLVQRVLYTGQSEERVRAHYAALQPKPVFLEEAKPESLYYSIAVAPSGDAERESMVTIRLEDHGYPSGLDLRCR